MLTFLFPISSNIYIAGNLRAEERRPHCYFRGPDLSTNVFERFLYELVSSIGENSRRGRISLCENKRLRVGPTNKKFLGVTVELDDFVFLHASVIFYIEKRSKSEFEASSVNL